MRIHNLKEIKLWRAMIAGILKVHVFSFSSISVLRDFKPMPDLFKLIYSDVSELHTVAIFSGTALKLSAANDLKK